MNDKGNSKNLNIPNALTVFRIIMVPWLICALVEKKYGAAVSVFAVAGLTDGLDGFIAKRFDMSTYLGSVLDPIADKILVASSVAVLAAQDALPVWLAVVIIGRDLIVFSGAVAYRILAGYLEMSPTFLSKINTFVQLFLILMVLLREAWAFPWAAALSTYALAVALFATVLSGAQYVFIWSGKALALKAGRL